MQADCADPAASLDGGFFAHAPDLLCVIGRDGLLKRVNPVWEQVLGYAIPDLLARPLVEFVHPRRSGRHA